MWTIDRLLAHLPSLTRRQAAEILLVIRGRVDPARYKTVAAWIGQCFNPPRRIDLKLAAVDEIMGGFGVECIGEAECPTIYGEPAAEYINVGDTYQATLLYDHDRAKWCMTTWGDWVETHEGAMAAC